MGTLSQVGGLGCNGANALGGVGDSYAGLMDFELAQTVEILERTPGVVRAMLNRLSSGWVHGNYGPDTFSPHDVVGHLITGERTDWIGRVRMILERGAAEPFSKFDRYAHFDVSEGKEIGVLLDEFELLRWENLRALRKMSLTRADLAKQGLHPALGRVTLEQLLATWAVHDLNHIAQIAKAMAAQYERAVGPWREYLGIYKSAVTRMDSEGIERRDKAMGRAGEEPSGS